MERFLQLASDRNFQLRVLSSLVLLPLGVFAVWAGGAIAIVIVAVEAMIIYAEWANITQSSRKFLFFMSELVIVTAAVLLLLQAYEFAAMFMVFLAISIGGMHLIVRNIDSWRALGALYAVAFLVTLMLLRQSEDMGFEATLYLVAIVWVTDTAAYLFGSMIGGPKLAPQISPKKTWSGFCGGVATGTFAGTLTAYLLHLESWMFLFLIAILIAVVSQLGDLFESWLKRLFHTKDSGALIPGHGGLLDRLDGLVAASIFVYIIGAFRSGFGAPASGLLLW